jgi:hypothetical protein
MYKITSTCLSLNKRNYFVSFFNSCLFFSLFLLILGFNKSYAQAVTVIACDVPTTFNCDPNNANSAIIMDTQPNKEFSFDNFSKYNGGITLNGSTILKLKVAASTSTLATGTCQWKLVMIVSNGGSPSVSTDWETLSSYGSSSASKPTIDNLFVRVSNGCNTPKNSGVWQQFNPADGDVIEIINPGIIKAAGAGAACSGGETNGAGTYLGADYNEYSFTIDYRLNPGFLYQPGRYEIFIKFCLVEK